MFYNMFFTTFALAFGKQPSRALDGESKEMLKMATKQNFSQKILAIQKMVVPLQSFRLAKNRG
ncbi:MAG: hypothetical protein IKA19_05335 [Muribaculaceae bacterium]|nr:hypothetical protein [Muribaculaceae bacterium]